jgi:putative peptide zinc metalloprotease protein
MSAGPRTRAGVAPVATDEHGYVVRSAVSGRYFRASPAVARIMRELDGTASPAEVAGRLGLEEPVVRRAIGLLEGAGLLEDGSRGLDRVARPGRRGWAESALLIRWDLHNGDGWVDWLYRTLRLRWCFHPAAIAVVTVLALAPIWDGQQLGSRLQHAYGHVLVHLYQLPADLVLAGAFVLLSSLLHEAGHAVACKHFGGQVNAIGIALYYLRPAFYTDVSDAWLFPRRRQRLATHAAGIAVNLALAALLLVSLPLWDALHQDGVADMAAVGVLLSWLAVLVNLNPLLKLDGYFLLVDLLRVPNLRDHAFAALSATVRRAAPAAGLPAGPERAVLAGYAVASLLYTSLLAWYMQQRLGALLGVPAGTGSLLLLALLLLLFTGLPLAGALRRTGPAG